jgi:hypothetical protein
MTTNEDLEEIYLERLIYLTTVDDMLEHILEYRHTVHIVQASHEIISRNVSQKNDIRVEAGLASA